MRSRVASVLSAACVLAGCGGSSHDSDSSGGTVSTGDIVTSVDGSGTSDSLGGTTQTARVTTAVGTGNAGDSNTGGVAKASGGRRSVRKIVPHPHAASRWQTWSN